MSGLTDCLVPLTVGNQNYGESATDTSDEYFEQGLQHQFFVGVCEAQTIPTAMVQTKTWTEAASYPKQQEAGLDICELCGGSEARTSQITGRRRLKAWGQFRFGMRN